MEEEKRIREQSGGVDGVEVGVSRGLLEKKNRTTKFAQVVVYML